jgi:hypothetical protein
MRHACFLTALLLAGLTLVVSGQPLPAQTHGPLSVHPENPRYFADRSGKAILLTGSHTWPNVVDMGPSDPPPAFDFDAYAPSSLEADIARQLFAEVERRIGHAGQQGPCGCREDVQFASRVAA